LPLHMALPLQTPKMVLPGDGMELSKLQAKMHLFFLWVNYFKYFYRKGKILIWWWKLRRSRMCHRERSNVYHEWQRMGKQTQLQNHRKKWTD
jgi:hypothetical protein